MRALELPIIIWVWQTEPNFQRLCDLSWRPVKGSARASLAASCYNNCRVSIGVMCLNSDFAYKTTLVRGFNLLKHSWGDNFGLDAARGCALVSGALGAILLCWFPNCHDSPRDGRVASGRTNSIFQQTHPCSRFYLGHAVLNGTNFGLGESIAMREFLNACF